MKSRVRETALKLLADGQRMTKYDLAASAPCDPKTAQRTLTALRSELLIRVAKWVPVYRQKIPMYVLGKGRDRRKPKPLSGQERMRIRRTDPSYSMSELMKKRAKRAEKSKSGVPDKTLTFKNVLYGTVAKSPIS